MSSKFASRVAAVLAVGAFSLASSGIAADKPEYTVYYYEVGTENVGQLALNTKDPKLVATEVKYQLARKDEFTRKYLVDHVEVEIDGPEGKKTFTYKRGDSIDIPGRAPSVEENTGRGGGGIFKPNLPTVDPGAMKWDGKGPKLAGKTGTGMIGTAKVTIMFTGGDKGGKFTVSGELQGEGEWRPDAAASVYMETQFSIFRGVLKGDKLAGVRFTKKAGEDGKNALTEWSIDLKDSSKGPDVPLTEEEISRIIFPLGAKESPKGPDPVGTWTSKRVDKSVAKTLDGERDAGHKEYKFTLKVNSDGTYSHSWMERCTYIDDDGKTHNFPPKTGSTDGKWKMENGKITFSPNSGRNYSLNYDGENLGEYKRAK